MPNTARVNLAFCSVLAESPTLRPWGEQSSLVAYCDVARSGQLTHSNRPDDCLHYVESKLAALPIDATF
jgi:hypothetical protein